MKEMLMGKKTIGKPIQLPGEIGGPPILGWLDSDEQLEFNKWFYSKAKDDEIAQEDPTVLSALLCHEEWRRDQMSALVDSYSDLIKQYRKITQDQFDSLTDPVNAAEHRKIALQRAQHHFLAMEGTRAKKLKATERKQHLLALLRPIIDSEADERKCTAKSLVKRLEREARDDVLANNPRLDSQRDAATIQSLVAKFLGYKGTGLEKQVLALASLIRSEKKADEPN